MNKIKTSMAAAMSQELVNKVSAAQGAANDHHSKSNPLMITTQKATQGAANDHHSKSNPTGRHKDYLQKNVLAKNIFKTPTLKECAHIHGCH